MSENKVTKVLDATSGDSSEFISSNNILTYKLSITGSPNSNIKAFFLEQINSSKGNFFFIKVSCSDWNSATVKLEAKSTHSEDAFTPTSYIFSEDSLKLFDY